MKKVLILTLTLMLCLGFAACQSAPIGFYREFPTVPSFGYQTELEPLEIINDGATVRYTYDISQTPRDAIAHYVDILQSLGFVFNGAIGDDSAIYTNYEVAVLINLEEYPILALIVTPVS